MKKTVKIISAILIAVMIVATIGSIAFAGVPGVIKTIGDGNSNAETAKLQNVGGTIVSILQVVGVVVAIVVIMIIGIKYMMGSAEEKAEYKKVMIPYVIGAVLIFAATTIVNVVYQISQGLAKSAQQG